MTFKSRFECQHSQEGPLNTRKWKYYPLIFPKNTQRLSFLALSIPSFLSSFFFFLCRVGEPRGLPSMGSHRVGHDWSDAAAAAAAADFAKDIFNDIWNDQLSPFSLLSVDTFALEVPISLTSVYLDWVVKWRVVWSLQDWIMSLFFCLASNVTWLVSVCRSVIRWELGRLGGLYFWSSCCSIMLSRTSALVIFTPWWLMAF